MTRQRLLPALALCLAPLLAALPGGAFAADRPGAKVATSPDQPRPRTGAYRVVSRGAYVTRAKCLEGGNVVVPTRQKATAAERSRAIQDACKTVDYSK